MTFAGTLPYVWPLAFILVALIVIRKIGDDIRPVASAVIGGVAKNAAQHSLAYAMATILAVLSGLNALAEVSTEFHWTYVVAATKILTPMLATIIAYLTKPPQFTQAAPDVPSKTVTSSPFAPKTGAPTTAQQPPP